MKVSLLDWTSIVRTIQSRWSRNPFDSMYVSSPRSHILPIKFTFFKLCPLTNYPKTWVSIILLLISKPIEIFRWWWGSRTSCLLFSIPSSPPRHVDSKTGMFSTRFEYMWGDLDPPGVCRLWTWRLPCGVKSRTWGFLPWCTIRKSCISFRDE